MGNTKLLLFISGTSSERADISSSQNDCADDYPRNSRKITKICFFCDLSRKKLNNVEVSLILANNFEETINEIKAFAKKKEDLVVLEKLKNVTAQDKVYYHKHCVNNFFRKKSTQKEDSCKFSGWHESREFHAGVRHKFFEMIQKVVIDEKKVLSLRMLRNAYETYYKDFLLEIKGNIDDFTCSDKSLLSKIKERFKNIQLLTYNKNVLIAAQDVQINLDFESIQELFDAGLAQTTAMKIRYDLLKVEKKPLPDTLRAKDLIQGEATVPAAVTEFVRTTEKQQKS